MVRRDFRDMKINESLPIIPLQSADLKTDLLGPRSLYQSAAAGSATVNQGIPLVRGFSISS